MIRLNYIGLHVTDIQTLKMTGDIKVRCFLNIVLEPASVCTHEFLSEILDSNLGHIKYIVTCMHCDVYKVQYDNYSVTIGKFTNMFRNSTCTLRSNPT